jgi:hypothetical protein
MASRFDSSVYYFTLSRQYIEFQLFINIDQVKSLIFDRYN